MTRCILIPEDEQLPLAELHAPGLSAVRAAVGGSIQLLRTARLPGTLIVDQEGTLKGRPLNQRATLIWWLHRWRARGAEVLVGPALLAGSVRPDGGFQDPGLFGDLIRSQRLQVKSLATPIARWEPTGPVLTDYFEAARHAIRLRGTDGWPRTRVVAAR